LKFPYLILKIGYPRREFLEPLFLYGLASVSIFNPPIINDTTTTSDHKPVEVFAVAEDDAVDRQEEQANVADDP
jgi:hypothetical protein